MKFSLIVGTYGRDEVLRGFLESLRKQTYRDFKFIIVDQNTDYRIKQICNEYFSDFEIQYLRVDKPGLSHARNIGLKYVSGGIVAFPDDDCEYPPDLLSRVNDFFTKNCEYNILAGAAVDTRISKRFSWFLSKPCILTSRNILKTSTSFSVFIKIKDDLKNFDEQFGIGSFFGSAEETDYILRFLQSGYKGYYDPSLEVYHLERNLGNMSLNTFYQYSLGLGAYLKKHTFFGRRWELLGTCLNLLFIRPVGGMLFSLVKLNLTQFTWYRVGFKGRIRGFAAYNRSCYTISKMFE
jgi:glycosyltransferase involved in cell wall biosynthesis